MVAGARVHVVPLGWEHDRCVLPFTKDGKDGTKQLASRVHLIVPDAAGAGDYPERVKKSLEKKDIKVIVHSVGRDKEGAYIEFQEILKCVAKICRDEGEIGGHEVCINLSAGSKLAAFAAGLAGMSYQHTGKVHLYYVRPDGYAHQEATKKGQAKSFRERGQSNGMRDLIWLDVLPLNQPSGERMQLLAFLLNRPEHRCSFLEAAQHLVELKVEDFAEKHADILEIETAKRLKIPQTPLADEFARGGKHAREKMRLRRNNAVTDMRRLVRPLLERKLELVRIKKVGRKGYLQLTDKGRTYALMAHDRSKGAT